MNAITLDLDILGAPADGNLTANDFVVGSSYNEGDAAKPIVGRVVVSSPTNVTAFSVGVSDNFDAEDVLELSAYGQRIARAFRIAYEYDAETGALTFETPTSLGVHQGVVSVLFREVLFRNGGTTPQTNDRKITFSVTDANANTAEAVSVLSVVDTNDAPVITAPATLAAIDEDGAFSFADFSVADSDGDILSVTISATSGDTPTPTGAFSFEGGVDPAGVTVSGNATGTITLQGASDALNAALAALRYGMGENANGEVSFIVEATEVETSTGTAIDSKLSDSVTRTLAVAAVNDAPVVDADLTFTVAEDSTDTATTVAALIDANQITDVDGDTVGIVITGVTIPEVGGAPVAVLEYKVGVGEWTALAVGGGEALLLGPTDQIRVTSLLADFNTAANPDLTPTISFRGWDQTQGTAGDTVTIDATGGDTAFSAAEGTLTIGVTAVNDAPVIDLDTGQDGTGFAKDVFELPDFVLGADEPPVQGYAVPEPAFDQGSDLPDITDIDSGFVSRIDIQITTDGTTAADGAVETLDLGIDGVDIAPLLLVEAGATTVWDANTATLSIVANRFQPSLPGVSPLPGLLTEDGLSSVSGLAELTFPDGATEVTLVFEGADTLSATFVGADGLPLAGEAVVLLSSGEAVTLPAGAVGATLLADVPGEFLITAASSDVPNTGLFNDKIAIDQAALLIHSVFYRNASQNPTEYGDTPERQIVFTVTDVDANGDSHQTASAVSTLTIEAFDNAPVVAAPEAAIEIASDQTASLEGVEITDIDSRTATLTIDVSAGPDGAKASQFSLADGYSLPAPLSFDNTGDQVVIGVDQDDQAFVATTDYLPLINALLDNIVYTPALDASFAALDGTFVVDVTVTATGDYDDPLLQFPADVEKTFTIKVTPALGGTTLSGDAPAIAEDTASGLIVITPADAFADLEFTAVEDGKLFLADANGDKGAEIVLNQRYDLDFDNGSGSLDTIRVIFEPAENFNNVNDDDTDAPGFTVRSAIGDGDGAPRGTAANFTPSITQVNDAPVLSFGGNATFPTDAITLAEDASVVFSTANNNAITLADVDDGEGSELPTVTLSVTDGGALTLGSTDTVIVDGDGTASVTVTGAIAAINAALEGLTYAPAQDFNGSATLTITANDNELGGTGALTDSETVDFAITAVNDAPVATVVAKTVDEDGSVVLTGFGVSDVDAGDGTITATLSVTNGTLTADGADNALVDATDNGTSGTLKLSGTVDAVNTALGRVTYAPAANFNGEVTATLTVDDGGNTGPVLPPALPTLEGFSVATGTFEPTPDAPAVVSAQTGFDNTFPIFTLELSLPAGATQVTLTLDQPVISTIPDQGSISGTVTLDVSGTNTIKLETSSSFTVTALSSDIAGTGFVAGVADPSAGALSDTQTATITVTPVNDAPVATGAATLAAIDEDTANPAGATVATLFAANFSDTTDNSNNSTADTLDGVIVTGVPDTTGKGTWQVKLPGAANWVPLSIGTNAGVFLSGDAELRFVPEANWHGDAPALTVQLVETGHGFTDGQTFATLPATGGTTAVSADGVSLSHAVNAVNDPVSITIGGGDLTVAEDSGANAVTGVTFTLSDPDEALSPDGVYRIFLTVQSFSSDFELVRLGGTGWDVDSDGGSASSSGTLAELRSKLSALTVTPADNWNGETQITVELTDAVGGVVATGSGSSTFERATIFVEVTPVNDPPTVIVPPSSQQEPLAATEDTPFTFSSANGNAISVADPIDSPYFEPFDAPDFRVSLSLGDGAGVFAVEATDGTSFDVEVGNFTETVTISGGGTSSLTLTGRVEAVDAVLAQGISFTPAADYNGPVTIFVDTVDDVSSGGFPGSNSIFLAVAAVNDAPVATVVAKTVDEDGSVVLSGFGVSDVDSGAETITATLNVTNGTLTANAADSALVDATDNGTSGTLKLAGTVDAVNTALARVTFTPAADFNGDVTATLTVDDGGNTGSGGTKTDEKTATITVTPVNDAPVASGAATLAAIDEDTANPAGATVATLFAANFSDTTDNSNNSTADTLDGVIVTGVPDTTGKGTWQVKLSGAADWAPLTLAGAPVPPVAQTVYEAALGAMDGFVAGFITDDQAPYASSADAIKAALVSLGFSGDLAPEGASQAESAAEIVTLITLFSGLIAEAGVPLLSTTPTQFIALQVEEQKQAIENEPLLESEKALLLDAVDELGAALVDALTGAAVGTLQFLNSTYGELGEDVTALLVGGAGPDLAGVFLSGDSELRFVPEADWSGEVPALEALLVETGSGYNDGDTFDTLPTSGGTTPISSASVQLSHTVNPVADTPTVTAAATTVNETDAAIDVAPVITAAVTDTDGSESLTRLFLNDNVIAPDNLVGFEALINGVVVAIDEQTGSFGQHTFTGAGTDADGNAIDVVATISIQRIEGASPLVVDIVTEGVQSLTLNNGATDLGFRLPAHLAGQFDFTVQAEAADGDDTAVSVDQTVEVTVTPVADAPSVTGVDATATIDEDGSHTLSGTVALVDRDGSEAITALTLTSAAALSVGATALVDGATVQVAVKDKDGGDKTVDATVAVTAGGAVGLAPGVALAAGTQAGSEIDAIQQGSNYVFQLTFDSEISPIAIQATVSGAGTVSVILRDGNGTDQLVQSLEVNGEIRAQANAPYNRLLLTSDQPFSVSSVTLDGDPGTDLPPTLFPVGGGDAGVTLTFDAADGVADIALSQFSAARAEHVAEDFSVAVTATATDANDDTATSAAETTAVTMTPVADAPSVTGVEATATINEDEAYTLSGTVALVDRDGSEAITALTLTSAAALSLNGTALADGDTVSVAVKGLGDVETTVDATVAISGDTVTLSFGAADGVADIALSQFSAARAEHVAEDFSVAVTATATDANNDTATSAAETTAVTMTPDADAPTVAPGATATAAEGAAAALSGTAALVDTDGSEALVSLIFNVPDGAQLTFGNTVVAAGPLDVTVVDTSDATKTVTATVTAVDNNPGTLVTVAFAASDAVKSVDLSQFAAGFVGADANGTFQLTVNATAQEGDDAVEQATTGTQVAVTITAVNDAPTSVAPASADTDEDTPLTFTGDLALSLADVDVAETVGGVLSVTLSVTNGTLSVAGDGVSFTGGTANGQATLSFEGTAAALNTALAGLSYTPTGDFNTGHSDNSETLTFTVSDNGNTGDGGVLEVTKTVPITVNPVNDAPAITAADSVSATEDTVFAFTGVNAISVSDVDVAETAGNLQVALSVTNGVLALQTGGVSVTAGASGSAAVTIVGTAADVNAALATLAYEGREDFNDTRGSEALTIEVSDLGATGSGDAQTASKTVTIAVAPVNDPIVAVDDTATTDEDTSVSITTLKDNDTDADNGEGETDDYTITAVSQPTSGSVSIDAGGQSVSFDPGAAFQDLDDGETRDVTFTYTASDGDTTDTATVTVTVTGVNDAPEISTNAGLTLDEGGTATIGNGLLAATDVDVEDLTFTVTALPSNGVLKLDGQDVAVDGTFTQADIDANRLSYVHDGGESTTDSFSVTVSDGDLEDSDSFAITVNPVNDAPTSAGPASITTDEDTSVAVTGLSVADSDADLAGGTGVTVTLAVGNGTLTLGTTTDVTFADGAGNGGKTVTFSGSVAAVNAALATLSYAPDQDFNTKAGGNTETLTVDVTDNGNTGSGGALAATQLSIPITVTPVNDGPSLTGSLDSPTFVETIGDKTGNAVFIASQDAFSGADVDLGDNPPDTLDGASLVVELTAGLQPEDVLAVAARGAVSVTGSDVSVGDTVVATVSGGASNVPLSITFNASATVDHVADVLEAVTFDNTTAIPAAIDDSATSRTVSVVFNDGRGAASDPVTGTIAIDPVNDAPTAGAVVRNGFFTVEDEFDEVDDVQTVAEFLSAGTLQTVDDDDDTPGLAGIAITAVDNTLGGEYVYRLSSTDAFIVIDGVSESTALVLGPDAEIAFRPTVANFNTDVAGAVTGSIAYRIWDQGPAAAEITSGDRADTRKGAGDEPYVAGEGPFSDEVFTTAANVVSVNDAPEVTAPGTQTIAEEGSFTFSGPNVFSVSDVDIDEEILDSGDGTVSVTVTATRGTLSATAANAAAVGGDGTATLTIDGLLADVNATLDGLVFTADPDQNGEATVTLSVDDNGNSSLLDDPQTGTGSVTVSITAVNDAPVVADGKSVRTLASVNEDVLIDPNVANKDAAAPGETILNLIGDAFDDSKDQVDGGSSANALAGIAITANRATDGEGVWRYKLAEEAEWATGATNVVPTDVSEAAAFVVPADASLRFEPGINFNDDVNREGDETDDIDFGLTARLIEDSAGAVTAADRVDVTASGGETAISAEAVVIETGVIGVPDKYVFLAKEGVTTVGSVDDIETAHTAIPGMVDDAGELSTEIGDIADLLWFDFGKATDLFEFDIALFNGQIINDPGDFKDKDPDSGDDLHFAPWTQRGTTPATADTMINVFSFATPNTNLAAAVNGANSFLIGFPVEQTAPLITIAFNAQTNQGGIVLDLNRGTTDGGAILLARFEGFNEDDMARFGIDDFTFIA